MGLVNSRLARMLIRSGLVAVIASGSPAFADGHPPAWTRPVAPFNVVGPIDYVGTDGLASYLIRTPDGAILIDAPMAENAAEVKRAIAARGVKLTDVKLILLSHAHFDHAGGLAALKKATGARLEVGEGDASAVSTGTPPGETDYGVIRFPAAPVDLAIKHGGEVRLGGVTLTAVSTAGHTPGCTSWRMSVPHQGRTVDVLFACNTTVAGNKLVANGRYPSIVEDFRRNFARLETLTPDVVLTFHPNSAELRNRAASNALVDRTAFRKMVANSRAAFEDELKRQQR